MPRDLSPRTRDGEYNVKAFGAKGDGTTDDTVAINAALQKCYDDGGGTVRIPPGEYRTSSPLIIRQNTSLVCDNNVRIFRTASGALIMNGEYDEDQSVYTGHGNIRIVGGVWDMRGTIITNANIGLAFAHGENITIEGVTVKDVPDNHAIEINSSKTVRIINCRFVGYYDGTASTSNEAVQIDLALTGGGTFGAFGLYDDTPCTDVLVQGCYFGASGTVGTVAWFRGVGSHSGKAGFEHTDVRIIGNHFDGVQSVAIPLYGYRRTIVADNTFNDCGAMIYANSAASQDIGDFTITGNIGRDFTMNLPIISIVPSTGTATNIVISGNAFDGTVGAAAHGMDMSRCTYVNVTGNTFANVAVVGIRFVGNCNDVQVTNNVISGTGDAGVQVTNSNNCVVSGNIIRSAGRMGVYSTSGTNLAIQGNTITEYGQAAGTSYGIRLSTGGTGYTVTDNIVRRTGGTGTDGGGIVLASWTGGYVLRNEVGTLVSSDSGTARSVKECKDAGPRTYSRSTTYTNATMTATNVLVSDLLAAGTYRVEICLFVKSTVATTPTLIFDLVAAGSSAWLGMAEWWTSATARNSSAYLSGVGADVTVAPNTGERIFQYSGTLTMTSSSTLALQMRLSAATATGSVMAGSRMTVAPSDT